MLAKCQREAVEEMERSLGVSDAVAAFRYKAEEISGHLSQFEATMLARHSLQCFSSYP